MRPNAKIEQKLETASRRFGKGINCIVLQGPIVKYLKDYGLIPPGVVFSEPSIAFSTKYRAFAVPMSKYQDLAKIAKQAGVTIYGVSIPQDQPAQSNFINSSEEDNSRLDSLSDLELMVLKHEPLRNFLRQNMLMIFINKNQLPKGRQKEIVKMDILVDSLDVGQSISGTLVPKSVNSGSSARWSDRRGS